MSRQAKYSRKKQSEVSDIGDIPKVKNPRRRARCKKDLHRFLREYFPHSTGQSPFSPDHERAIGRVQECELEGGLFAECFPRGFAKTTISENSVLHAVLYGHRRFIAIFGSSADAASSMIESIKMELTENDLLYEDFPEVCHAIRALEGKPQRCASQTHGGNLTYIEWTAEKIVMPAIKGSKAGGTVVMARGITGATRGLKHKTAGGDQIRPDLVILDDPQTDESANTDLQVSKRMAVIKKSILKLGGHSKKIAVVMNATIIRRGDLVDQICDQKKNPAWQSERIKMVKVWSDAHDTLWLDKYRTIRNTFDPLLLGDQKRAHRDATEFYKENREAMDAGCIVSWEHCFDKSAEISAIQHAYNLLIDDGPEVFASECQNEPLADEEETELAADTWLTTERLNRVPIGIVPLQSTRLVSHIDVQGNLLYWMVVAFDEMFGPSIVDFGTWPKVDRQYFALRDIRKSLMAATGADSQSAAIHLAVQRCADELKKREWKRSDGATLDMEKIGVDANWGPYTDEVYKACRESPHASIMLPTHGRYYGAKSLKRFEDAKPQPGDRIGMGWRLVRAVSKTKHGIGYLLIDTNRWKTMTHKRMTSTPGSPGALMLPGSDPQRFRLLLEHLFSEKGIMVEALGRTAEEWSARRTGGDNHWWDNLVSCHAIANVIGVREPTAATSSGGKKRVKFSELQKAKQANRN